MNEEFISSEDASNLSGYLHKKSASIFGGWQKRYFSIQDARFMIYSSTKGGKAKGVIDLEKANVSLDNSDIKSFKIIFSEKAFILKADTEEDTKKWFEGIKNLISIQNKNSIFAFENVENNFSIDETMHKSNPHNYKVSSIENDAINAMQKSGQYGENRDLNLSMKLITIKGIKKHIVNIPSELIESRMIFGFLHKRHNSTVEIYQKRWHFLISSRPLNDIDYENDDISLEEKILPSFIQFDHIYYYKVEDENDSSEAIGNISLVDCQGIELKVRDSRFFIVIDMGDVKFELYTEIMGERDIWFEAIKNSRRTAKDFKNSLSRLPRNLNKLVKMFEREGLSSISIESEQEKNRISQVYLEIGSFDILEMLILNLKKHLFQTIDGCIIFSPPRLEILKLYVDVFNYEILVKVQDFWKKSYEHISNVEIINLGCLLYEFQEQLLQFGVNDPNFALNARELFKIYGKKTFLVMKELLDDIMKSEREIKAVRGANEIFITNSPTDIFKMMYETLEIIKNKKVKPLFEHFLYILKESIFTYLVGVDYLVNRSDLEIDKEFLIAISNNSIRINTQLCDIIQDIKSFGVIEQIEIEEHLNFREICNILNNLSNLSIIRLVRELSAAIIKDFNIQFDELETDKIINKTIEVYGRFVNYMHLSSQNRLWKEVLKYIMYHYIKSLLTTAWKRIKILEEITNKVKYDRENLEYIFERFLGAKATKEQLKIIYDLLDFLETSPEMISICLSKLRQNYGYAFTFTLAKSLINLRIDMSSSDKKETIKTCEQILEKIEINPSFHNIDNGLFNLLEEYIKEVDKNDIEENECHSKKIDENCNPHKTNYNNSLNNLSGEVQIKSKDKGDSDILEVKRKDKEFFFIKLEDKIKKDSDILISGYMHKKSYSRWQERFFTLKNGFLYWYKNDETREAQNFFSLADCKNVSIHKQKKFMMIIQDKLYKFACKTEEERDKWIKIINNEIIRFRGEIERKVEKYYQVKLRKKVIVDYTNLPTPRREVNEVRRKIENCIMKENCFLKKEALEYNNKDLSPNRDIVDKRPPFKEEILRIKPVEVKPLNMEIISREVAISENSETGLNGNRLNQESFEEKEKKKKSIFDCCIRCFKLFKPKKKPYNEFEC